MPEIREVDILADFNLTLDHFYSIVKTQIGGLQARQYLQLQATAIPFDVSPDYKWFSYGTMNRFFDVRMDPTPVASNITLEAAARLSDQYLIFMADLISLVEVLELDKDTLEKIDKLRTRINNNDARVTALIKRRMDDWIQYAEATMLDRGSLTQFTHWQQGHHTSREIADLVRELARDGALMSALTARRYASADHQAVADAYAAVTGPASRMRYPLFPDSEYPADEVAKFSATYFASLPDNDSSLYRNLQLMTSMVTLGDITTSEIGKFSDKLTKESVANSTVTTDWSASGSAGWGPFKVRTEVSSHEKIRDDFSHTQSISVGATSLQAIPIDASVWFRPDMFRHPLVKRNRRLFEPYLGPKGSLLYFPTHLIVARGMNLTFTSSQNWQHDYEKDFSASGSASGRIFGVGFGGGGRYSQTQREQKVERRGNDLVLDDGDNIRILGYVVTKNADFDDDFIAENQARFAQTNF